MADPLPHWITCSRFIVNMIEEYEHDAMRLMFAVEEAYWYYKDFFMADPSKGVPSLNITEFAVMCK